MDDFIRAKNVLEDVTEEAGLETKIKFNRSNETFTIIILEGNKTLSGIVPPPFSKTSEIPDGATYSIDWKLFKRYYNEQYS